MKIRLQRLLRPVRTLAVLTLALVATPAPTAAAASFSDVARAVSGSNWTQAERAARALDTLERHGEFFAAYVAAARLVSEGRCDAAVPALELLAHLRPYFVAAREQIYLCHRGSGDAAQSLAELDAMLAVLPDGPQRDLVVRLRQSEAARYHPVVDLFGGITPTTNANRATDATHLPGSGWAITERGAPGVLLKGGASVTRNLILAPGMRAAAVVRAEIDYSTLETLLYPALTLEVPMTFGELDSTALMVSPFASVRLKGTAYARGTVGARGVVSTSLGGGSSLSASVSGAFVQYHQSPHRDGIETDAALSLALPVGEATRFTATVAAASALTIDEARRWIEVSTTARLDHLTPSGLVLGLEAGLGQRWHASPAPGLPSDAPGQVDTFVRAKAELSHRDWRLGPTRPGLYYEVQRQVSDNVFYDFVSHDVGASLKARF